MQGRWKGTNPSYEGTSRPPQKRWQTSRWSNSNTLGQREIDGLGRHYSWHFHRVLSELHSLHCSWAGSSSQTGSRQQDCKVSGTWKKHIFFPSCYRDSGIMESARHWTGARNRETHHCHHRGQLRNHLPVSEAVSGSAEGKCGLILRHFPARLVSRYSHSHLWSKPAALCYSYLALKITITVTMGVVVAAAAVVPIIRQAWNIYSLHFLALKWIEIMRIYKWVSIRSIRCYRCVSNAFVYSRWKPL